MRIGRGALRCFIASATRGIWGRHPEVAWRAAAPRDPIAYALSKVQEIPDPFFKARTLTAMAGKYAACLEKDQARHVLRMARHTARFIGNPHDRVWALAHIGFQYVRAGEPTRG
jgi:hypothetical protein